MKFLSKIFAAFVIATSLGLAIPAASAQQERPSTADFWERQDFFRPAISPNGRFIAYVKREGEEQYVVTIDLDAADGDLKSVPVGKVRINNLDWLTDERLLVDFTGYYGRRSNRPVSWEKVRQMNEEGKILWRTVKTQNQSAVMKRDGSDPVTMFDGSPLRTERGFNATLVSELPSDPTYIIMQAPDQGKLHLFKVNIATGEETRIARGSDDTGGWFVDQNGDAVLRWDFKYNNRIVHSYAKRTDSSGKDSWVRVKIGPTDTFAENGGEAFRPLAPSDQPNKYYATARPEGANTVGLYLYDYTNDTYGEPVRSDTTRDIETVRFNRSTLALSGITYSGAKSITEYIDPNTQAHMDGLQVFFGNEANVTSYQTDVAEQKLLLSVVTPSEGRAYYLYDKQTQSPIKLGNPNGALRGKAMSAMEIIRYTGRDGLELFGYLSRPVDALPTDKPPLVVMPHGGPQARDNYGFDIIAQSLTAQGYQVFQPQFRGSSGQGLEFAEKGHNEWGKAMQHDVDDGFDHIVSLGLADADRACLMGFSYGGYAAFAAATLTPEKYQCILAGAGVSDLPKMLRWERDDAGVIEFGQPRPGKDSYAFRYWSNHIGDLVEDKDAIEATSPARLADRIVRPMFIFHGEDDRIVPIEQSRMMMEAMDRANKPYEWHMMIRTGHAYGYSAASSVETLEKAIAFLNKHLPVN